MNLVLDNAEELDMKKKQRTSLGNENWMYEAALCPFLDTYFILFFLGRILLKGDNITLLMQVGGSK